LTVGFTPRLRRALRYFAAILAAAAVTAASFYLFSGHASVEVTFLDVSQGESIFIKTSEGKTILVDGGSSNIKDVGRRVLLPFFRNQGVRRLDYILITHFDLDHYSGLSEVIRNLKVDLILRGPMEPVDKEPAFEEFISEIKSQKIPTRTVKAGDVIRLDSETRLDILSPDEKLVESGELSVNNGSVVAKLVHGGFSLLLGADIEHEMEYLLVRQRLFNLKSTVIKVPHHGSDSSSTTEFIRAVDPAAAVISCGSFPRAPANLDEVVERYHDRDIEVLRTDLGGAIHLKL
ncbi:unnamed protein product, partial [marine sediment metagenome]